MDTVSEFHAEVPQATASEGLAQGPYVAAREGFKPTILQTKGDESTNELPRPANLGIYTLLDSFKDSTLSDEIRQGMMKMSNHVIDVGGGYDNFDEAEDDDHKYHNDKDNSSEKD